MRSTRFPVLAASLLFCGCFGPQGMLDDASDAQGDGAPEDAEGSSGDDAADGDDTSADSDSSDGDGSGGAGGDDAEEPATCGPGRVCVAGVPEHWSGPVASARADASAPEPRCAGEDYGQLAFAPADAGLTVPALTCDCDCVAGAQVRCVGEADIRVSPPSDGFLSPCTLQSGWWQETVESGTTASASLSLDDTVRGLILDGYSSEVTGSCTPVATEEKDDAYFDSRLIACKTADIEEEGCDGDEVCVPQPGSQYDGDVCIWRAGDHPCPAGYGSKRMGYHGLTDDRTCTACECGSPSGDCSGETISFQGQCWPIPWCPNGDCSCPQEPTFDADDVGYCEPLASPDFAGCSGDGCADADFIVGVAYDAGTPDAACPATGGEPTGEAVGLGAITMCCTGG